MYRRPDPICSIARAALAAVFAVGLAACGTPADPSPDPSSPPATVDPARIDRARGALPPGYEVSDLSRRAGPAALWGYGEAWRADPPGCAALADPLANATTVDGWSASGPGGIVSAVAAAAPGDLDRALVDACGRWEVSGGRTSGSVRLDTGPAIDGAATVAMATDSTTVVEGGTETRSHAETVTAYLGEYVVFVAVVTDPGSPDPLGGTFAAELLEKTVAALRGRGRGGE